MNTIRATLHRGVTASAALALTALLSACGEAPQDAQYVEGKGYGGKEDSKPYSGDAFKGDRKKWEQALSERNRNQNEYLRIERK